MNRSIAAVFALLLLPACVVSDIEPDVDPYGHQVRISGGWFDAREDDQLPREDDGGAFEVGGTLFTGTTSPLALDAQIMFTTNRYDTIVPTPPFGSIDGRTTITTSGFELGPRLVFGRHQDLRAFVRGGGGLYSSAMTVDATASGLEGEYDEDDFAPGAYAGFGLEGRFQRVWIGLEWRWLFVEGDFGAPFDVNDVDLGGGVAALTLGFAF
jgi:hypothetical protein